MAKAYVWIICTCFIHVCLLTTNCYCDQSTLVPDCQCMCKATCEEYEESNPVEFQVELPKSCINISSCSDNGTTGNCGSLQNCCWKNDYLLECLNGPSDECSFNWDYCSTPNASDCKCYLPEKGYYNSNDETNPSSLVTGIGVGLGVAVLIAVIVGITIAVTLTIYCHFGRRNGGQRTRVEQRYTTREGDFEQYAGIPVSAVTNQGYNISEVIDNPVNSTIDSDHTYLIEPNQDMRTDDHMDPDEHTEPSTLPERNSPIKDEEEDNDEDHISQESPTLSRMESSEDHTPLEDHTPSEVPKATSEDYLLNVTDQNLP